MHLFAAATALVGALAGEVPSTDACSRQPLPAAIDSVGKPPIASEIIEFAATPSLQVPESPWVVRVYWRGEVEAKLEIFRLRHQSNCNRYDIEKRWDALLEQQEFGAIAADILPFSIPPKNEFAPGAKPQQEDLVLDGTGIQLRFRSFEWQVTRSLNHDGRSGGPLSKIYYGLVRKYVPASELPSEDWRSKRAR